MIRTEVAGELRANEQEEILRKRLFLRRLPSELDQSIIRSTDLIQRLLADPGLDRDYCARLASTCSKTVTQFKFDLMTIHLDAIQAKFRAHHLELRDLKENLLQSTALSSVLKQTISIRHQSYLEHKLKTFFDVAPVTKSNE